MEEVGMEVCRDEAYATPPAFGRRLVDRHGGREPIRRR